jgi:nitrile hydratase accessory protein
VTAALDVAGPAAPPRSNGELVFAEPWESRAFGMAVTLADAGAFTWDEFRDRLVARIAAWEAEHGAAGGADFRYYACWLDALEDVLVDGGTLTTGDVADRSATFAQRPTGHDHRDDDGHGHGHGH